MDANLHFGKLMPALTMLGTTCYQLIALLLWFGAAAHAADMQPVSHFSINRTEVTIGQFAKFAQATGTVTKAERDGGGLVYEAGWQRKTGWTWRTPYGTAGSDDEPAVHVTFEEARAYCTWAGKRLPTSSEWREAAHIEQRLNPPAPFKNGTSYPYPTGETPEGANCLRDCGVTPALNYSAVLQRGRGHARVGTTKAGVNGLFDMGANVWEWVNIGNTNQQGTLGGSWWYGSAPMRKDHSASKPRDMAAVYIGFRCVRDINK